MLPSNFKSLSRKRSSSRENTVLQGNSPIYYESVRAAYDHWNCLDSSLTLFSCEEQLSTF